jgi:hypothetical protein
MVWFSNERLWSLPKIASMVVGPGSPGAELQTASRLFSPLGDCPAWRHNHFRDIGSDHRRESGTQLTNYLNGSAL